MSEPSEPSEPSGPAGTPPGPDDHATRTRRGGSVEAALNRAVEEAARLLHADGAMIYLYDPEIDGLRFARDAGIRDQTARDLIHDLTLPVGVGMFGTAFARRELVTTRDYRADPSFSHSAIADQIVDTANMRSMAVAPLVVEGESLGALGVYLGRPAEFDDAELGLLRALADHAAVTLANERLQEDLRRKAAELEASERRYRFLVERAPDIVYEIGPDGRFTFVSEAIESIAGWAPDELCGRPFTDIIAPESLAEVTREWEAVSADPGTERRVDFGLLRRDGSGAVPVETRAIGVLADGVFAGVHGSTRDISERVRLENDLRHRSEELARRVEVQRTLSEIARQLTAIRDPAVVLQLTVNEAARLLHADGGEMDLVTDDGRGLRLAYTFVPEGEPPRPDSPDLPEPNLGIAGRALAEGRVVATGDYLNDPSFHHAPEADAWVAGVGMHSELAAPLIGEQGPVGVILMDARRRDAWDDEDAGLLGALAAQATVAVTNARLWAQVESSERRYRHLVENSPDTIWSARADGTLTYFSETIERLSGWKADELVGKHFRILVHPDSGQQVNEEWQRMVDANSPDLMIRFHLRHRDGHPIPAETTGIPEVVDGRVVGAHGAVRDISVRERLEEDLREQAGEIAASQERANLARELHDSVTQALFSMGLTMRSLELLLEADPDAARGKLAELRELQKDALAEMRTLIFELRPKSLEQDGLEQALRTHAASVQGRTGLSVTVEADTGVPERLPIDVAEAFYRIGQEALHNVVKHANASSARILLARVGGEIRLSVTDDGVGFDPANTPRGQLGLVGMRQRAERIGAELSVTSRPGHGAAVSVTWRLPESAEGGEGHAGVASGHGGAAGTSAE